MSPAASLLSRRAWLQAAAGAAAALAAGPSSLLAQAGPAAGRPLRLTLNESFFGPSPLALSALRQDLEGLERYVGDEADAFVRQVAAYEGVAPEQIVTGEILEPLGLQLALRDGAGGEFVYTVPGYPALVNAAARVGGKVVSVPLDGRLGNDLAALAAAVTPRTRAVFLVNPHNPSGTASPPAEFLAFVRDLSRRTLVVVDEAYLEYTDDFAGRTAVALTRAGENVLVFRTFAKVWGLAALPLGYAVAPRPVADFLRQAGLGSPRDLNRLALTAAGASLRDPNHIRHVRLAVARARDQWHAFLDERQVRRTESVANFVFFDAGRPHAAVAQRLREAGILIGRAFPPYDTWVRITLGTPAENARVRDALRPLFS